MDDFLNHIGGYMILKTKRLTVRPFQITDLDLVFKINNHLECIEFNGWDKMDLQACKEVLDRWIKETNNHTSYGVFCVEDEYQNPIGMTFLMKYEWTQDYEVGFRLAREHWGNGYATELTRLWIKHCRDVLHANSIRAEVAAANKRSLDIFRRLGFEELRQPSGGEGVMFIRALKKLERHD